MLKAKDIMNSSFETVSGDTNVQKICSILAKNKVSSVPVVKNGKKLIGFVSERDIVSFASKSRDIFKKEAKDIMTKNVISVKENTAIEQISKIFTEHLFRHIPVIRKGIVVGVISRKQVIDRLLGQYY